MLLAGGQRVTLRLVRPDDKPLLARGFERASERTRYLRFFASRERLTRSELRYLTEVDQQTHFAMGAVHTQADGTQDGVAVARFIQLPDEPKVAEPAIAVLDGWQNKGLGRALLLRLMHAAHERGYDRLRSEVLADNDTARVLLRELAPEGTVEGPTAGGVVVVDTILSAVRPVAER